MNADNYIVICLAEPSRPYMILVTRRVFTSYDDAAAYAATIHPERCAQVVAGDFSGLRFPTHVAALPEGHRLPEPRGGFYGDTSEEGVRRGNAELDKLRRIPRE